MGTNILLSLIVGVAMTAIVGSQIGPNYIEQIKIKKVQTKTINNQDIIFEGIKRYVTIKQVQPNSLQDVINAGYLDPNVNDNGFSGNYSINVDKAKGVATITTTITDKSVHETFLNSFTNMSKPSCTGIIIDGVCDTNTFKTTFVIPNEVMHGNALLMTGVPIQTTPPDSNIYKYWYDTSSGKATLKLFDGTNWIKVDLNSSGGAIGSIDIYAGAIAPDGYLFCRGQTISRTTYVDLFNVIGTTYGAGDGSTTFNVPDLRGEFIRGFDAGRGVDSGRILGSWQVDELKSHKHSYFFGGEGVSSSIGASHTSNIYSSYGNTAATGGIETRPRNIAMNYIIKH